jgi:hypothetical protein
MQDVGRVNVLETAADLVDKVLVVRICERLATADDLVQIGFHEFLHEIAKIKQVI